MSDTFGLQEMSCQRIQTFKSTGHPQDQSHIMNISFGLYCPCFRQTQVILQSIIMLIYWVDQILTINYDRNILWQSLWVVIFKIVLNSQYNIMLADLKLLEDKLFLPQPLAQFNQKYPIHQIIKQLNKASKKQTRDRIKTYLYKISNSNHYKDFLYACLAEENDKKKDFIKYVSSEYSEQFFTLLVNKRQDVLVLIENNQVIVPVLMKIIGFQFGIKLIKLFKHLYQIDSFKYECLYSHHIFKGLEEGLGFYEGEADPIQGTDTVAQTRYLEIVVNIALVGGQCFKFVGQLLNRALNLYNTEDILLKMAIVQIISVLGDGVETSLLLKQHRIWKSIQKDAGDVDQQFYVRKFLLLLLVDMVAQGHYSLSSKMGKDIQSFLRFNLTSGGQFLQAAIDLIGHLFKSYQGCQLVVHDKQIFHRYVKLSIATLDSIKCPYYTSIQALTHIDQGKQAQFKKSPKYRLAINILNCIGSPDNVQSFTSNSLQTTYIQGFNRWFSSLLKLPFQDAELILIEIFTNLLNYYQVAESLFQVQDITKYLLKPISGSDSNKVLKGSKLRLITTIINKGQTEWKGLQLSEYSRNLQKLLKGRKEQAIYALDVE